MALLIKRIPAVTLPKAHDFGQWLIAFHVRSGAMYNYIGLILDTVDQYPEAWEAR